MIDVQRMLATLSWNIDVTLYADKGTAELAATAEAQRRGERIVYEPTYDEDLKAWTVAVWTPPKRASRPKRSGRSAGARGRK